MIKTGDHAKPGSSFKRNYGAGTLRLCNSADVAKLAENLREADLEEIGHYYTTTPKEVIEDALVHSKMAFTIDKPNGDISGMVGVAWRPNPRAGRIWLLSSSYIEDANFEFLLASRHLVKFFLTGHDVLFNDVYSGNHKSIKWLEWLGFERVSELENIGDENVLFYQYMIFASEEVKKVYMGNDWPYYGLERFDQIMPQKLFAESVPG